MSEQPNENEATVAVDAAARVFWDQKRRAGSLVEEEGVFLLPEWDELDAVQKQQVRQVVLPTVWAALQALGLVDEYGRRIKDGSGGNGHMEGHVSSLYATREEAEDGLAGDQEVVVRRVSGWEPA